jgi:hypothetical protein
VRRFTQADFFVVPVATVNETVAQLLAVELMRHALDEARARLAVSILFLVLIIHR